MSAADIRNESPEGMNDVELAVDAMWPDCSLCGDTGWMELPAGGAKVRPCFCVGLQEPPRVGGLLELVGLMIGQELLAELEEGPCDCEGCQSEPPEPEPE